MDTRDEVAQPNAQDITPMVEIDGLDKWFGEHHVVRGVSMNIGRGERIVLCGPPRSGRSALLRCIVGLDEAERGSIRVDGIELSADERSLDEVRRRVGMVFRQFNLFPHLTVMGNLLLGPMCEEGAERATLEARADEVLGRVGLAAQKAKFPRELSAGQQQRVTIARALMREPKLLLFDEPTAAVPPEKAGEIFKVMAELAEGDITMLIICHDMDFAREFADLVVYMDRGEIIDAAPPSAFVNEPGHDLTQAFLNQRLRH